jgi:hypothetical protein
VEDLWNIDMASDSDDDSDMDECKNDSASIGNLPVETEAASCTADSASIGDPPLQTEAASCTADESKTGNQTTTEGNSIGIEVHSDSKQGKHKTTGKRKPGRAPERTVKASRPRLDYESFYRDIEKSKDKLFIIAENSGNRPKKDWFLVQVDWDETVMARAKSKGRYHCRWYVRHHKDSATRLVSECRFWPEIHEFKPGGHFGALQLVKPSKAIEQLLEDRDWAWYQREINLFADHIVGPFNFTTINKETHRIDPSVWNELRTKSNPSEVDLLSLDRLIQLDSWKR